MKFSVQVMCDEDLFYNQFSDSRAVHVKDVLDSNDKGDVMYIFSLEMYGVLSEMLHPCIMSNAIGLFHQSCPVLIEALISSMCLFHNMCVITCKYVIMFFHDVLYINTEFVYSVHFVK